MIQASPGRLICNQAFGSTREDIKDVSRPSTCPVDGEKKNKKTGKQIVTQVSYGVSPESQDSKHAVERKKDSKTK